MSPPQLQFIYIFSAIFVHNCNYFFSLSCLGETNVRRQVFMTRANRNQYMIPNSYKLTDKHKNNQTCKYNICTVCISRKVQKNTYLCKIIHALTAKTKIYPINMTKYTTSVLSAYPPAPAPPPQKDAHPPHPPPRLSVLWARMTGEHGRAWLAAETPGFRALQRS